MNLIAYQPHTQRKAFFRRRALLRRRLQCDERPPSIPWGTYPLEAPSPLQIFRELRALNLGCPIYASAPIADFCTLDCRAACCRFGPAACCGVRSRKYLLLQDDGSPDPTPAGWLTESGCRHPQSKVQGHSIWAALFTIPPQSLSSGDGLPYIILICVNLCSSVVKKPMG